MVSLTIGLFFFFVFTFTSSTTSATSANVLNGVAFVILSQPFKLHSEIAKETKSKVEKMLKKDGIENPFILTLHEDLDKLGGWTIFPILPDLEKIPKVFKKIRWFAFLPGNVKKSEKDQFKNTT